MHDTVVLLSQNVPEGRVFGLDLQTLISIGIQLFNAIFLAVVLGFILYKPVKEFMQKRTDRIQSKINAADATMARANELIAEYNLKLQEIEKERSEILEAARIQAAEESREILEKARQEASEIRKRSLESVFEYKKRLKEETRLHIIEIASSMAEKYISQKIDEQTQDKLFEEALAQLEDAQWLN